MPRPFRGRPDRAGADEQNVETVARPPSRVDRLLVPEGVLQQTLVGLSLAHTRESLAYWLGTGLAEHQGASRAIITTVAFPSTRAAYDHFEVVDGQMGLVTSWCAERGLWVLGQVHTHPTDEPHSQADETWPASHRPGFFSVVIPYFAQLSTLRTQHLRAYERDGDGNWIQVSIEERFDFVEQVWIPPQ